MNILVVVDMQNDFIDCALGTPEAVAAVPSVIQEVQSKEYDMVFATMDTHGEDYLDHLEGKYLPVKHCLKGTEGWKIQPEIEFVTVDDLKNPSRGGLGSTGRV